MWFASAFSQISRLFREGVLWGPGIWEQQVRGLYIEGDSLM